MNITIGALICGENTNPLARYTLIAQGEQVHVSSYPPVWPTREPGDAGRYDLASAIRIRAGAHSFEGKVFNVVASAVLDRAAFDVLSDLEPSAIRTLEESPRGVSMVLGPSGEPISDDSFLLLLNPGAEVVEFRLPAALGEWWEVELSAAEPDSALTRHAAGADVTDEAWSMLVLRRD